MAICVLGAHRSGTSLTARVLGLLGVYLGPEEELMEPAEGNNPAGFWEHREIADLNEDILATLGRAPRQRWRWPPALADGWQRDPRLDAHRDTARSILERSFAGHPLWGWKDPRTCLTLPFWQDALVDLPEVESRLRYVICIRHPLDVAASLQGRDGMEVDEALVLWARYMSDALGYTRGRPRLVVSYESFFPGWEDQARRLAEFAGLAPPSRAQLEAIAGHIDESLRHHRDAEGAGELPASCASLYGELTALAQA